MKQAQPIRQEPEVFTDAAVGKTLWQLALEGAGQGVWDHDVVKGRAYYSPTWYRMRGFQDGEDVDAELGAWFDRLHPDERDSIIETTHRQNSGEILYNNFEYRERHRDGSWIWILSRGRPVAWKPDGSVARIVGTDTDITPLKKIEQQLAEEKERLHVTLQSIADGMISTGPTGKVTFINAAAEQITGWPLSEAIGKTIKTVFPLFQEGATEDEKDPIRACLEQGKTITLENEEIVLYTRSGARTDVRVTASPVLGRDGSVLGSVLVFQDVTQSRALKRELTHSATHDILTGLPNRTAFNRAIEAAAESARTAHREHALCYIDLDHFKAVNDGAGHAAGDEVLVRIAEIVYGSCRTTDFAGRIGGDEFILLLSDCSLDHARRACEKIIKQVASETFNFAGSTYRIGASIGVTTVTYRQPSATELTTEADAACYVAKSEGRGRVAVFPRPLDVSLSTSDNISCSLNVAASLRP